MNKTQMLLILAVAAVSTFSGCDEASNEIPQSGQTRSTKTDSATVNNIVRYGTMREAIGEQQDHGRVRFADLFEKPHFYGVAAMENLEGEAAIIDGELTVSIVDDNGQLESIGEGADQRQATILVGGYVSQWHEIVVDQEVPATRFDAFVASSAESLNVKTDQPFLFTVEGEFSDLHLHVINGACPVHTRMKKQEFAADEKPFEMNKNSISGTMVGVFARDAVGKLTHPASETHRHLVFVDDGGRKQVGHVEGGGIRKGARLRIAR